MRSERWRFGQLLALADLPRRAAVCPLSGQSGHRPAIAYQSRFMRTRLVVPGGVIASQQPIPAAGRDIDLMEAASLRAMRNAITATQAFEMQNKDLQIPRIGS